MITALFATFVAAVGVSGQVVPIEEDGVRRRPALVLVGGWASGEAAGIRGGAVLGATFEFPLAEWAVLAPAIDRRTSSGWPDGARPEWTVEFLVRAQHDLGRIRPWVGGGLGAAFDFREDREFTEDFLAAVYAGTAGVAVDLVGPFGARAETRWRFIDGFDDATVLTTAGVSIRLGRRR